MRYKCAQLLISTGVIMLLLIACGSPETVPTHTLIPTDTTLPTETSTPISTSTPTGGFHIFDSQDTNMVI
jgi:hypothetical protein